MAEQLNGTNVEVTDNHLFIFPREEEITDEDLRAMINKNVAWSVDYQENWKLYIGEHDILNQPAKQFGPDNRLVVNLPHYIVDTFNGYFLGIPPKITLDEDQENQALQQWNDTNSLQDKLNEVSKLTDIYGRAMLFAYQNEDSETKIAVVAPTEGFIVYDDRIARQPIAFIRYAKSLKDAGYNGTIYYADKTIAFTDTKVGDEGVNQFGLVPAVEFFENEERQGTFDNVKSLVQSLDKVLSQKANQIEYFDNAYLKMLGLNLDQDGDGKPDIDIRDNHLIYSSDAESANAQIDFISKPDADGMQENMINRLVDMVYQVSMVANLNDKEFSGNSSGVALKYKLLPMQNMAANKERKFTQSLRQLYRVLFSVKTIVNDVEAWQRLSFQFTRNMPANLLDEAQTAQELMGVTSHETAMKPLSVVDDPKQEMEKIREEQAEATRNALRYSPSATDQEKVSEDDENDKEIVGFRKNGEADGQE